VKTVKKHYSFESIITLALAFVLWAKPIEKLSSPTED
jgi:hypothetical protein